MCSLFTFTILGYLSNMTRVIHNLVSYAVNSYLVGSDSLKPFYILLSFS